MFSRLWEFVTWQLPPHGYCLLWDPALIAAHVGSDALIAFSYYTIPLGLIMLVRERGDVKFSWIFWLFATFIMACGTTHVMMIWNLWHGDYGVEALVKMITAAASVGTAVVFWIIYPQLKTIPSTRDLENLTKQLQAKVEERDQAILQFQREKEEKEKAQSILLQSQKMDAVGQLTGGIAHDFNNLLMAISGNLELIKCNPKSDRVQKWVGTGIDAVARAAHLTAQLLTFSSKQKLQLKEVDLKPLLANISDMIVRTLGPGIKVKVVVDDDVVVVIDPIQIELAILNLCINSRDAMPDGGNLSLTTQCVGDHVEIDIKDTGTGIPEEVVDRIFEPFFTTKEVGKGTGLGLSMVYGVASQSGGDVFIKKTSGTGTTMTISLPVKSSKAKPIPPKEKAELIEGGGRTVLVIDDERIVREVIVDILSVLGYQTVQCEDGVEALAYLKANKPDLIMVDFSMPVMNGAAVAKATRLIYDDVPIVFVTGYSDSAQTSGYPVLKKPLGIEEISTFLLTIFPVNKGSR